MRGSHLAIGGYFVAALLIPRPLMIPIGFYLLWRQPGWRLPFAALFAGHALLVIATGLAPEWMSTLLEVSPDIRATSWNLSPTRWMGLWWLLIGVPLAGWLLLKGKLGFAGLAISPHIWPYTSGPNYLLFALPPVNRETRIQRDASSLHTRMVSRQRSGSHPGSSD